MNKKLLLSSLTISSIVFSGCSTLFEQQKEPYEPQNIKQLEVFADKRINDFNKRYYEKNFITKKVASSEMEIGLQTINKEIHQNYLKEEIKKDDLDVVPKINVKIINTETKIINDLNQTEIKNVKKVEILNKNLEIKNLDAKYDNNFQLLLSLNNELKKKSLNSNKEYVLTISDNNHIEIYEVKENCNIINNNLSCYQNIENGNKYNYQNVSVYFKFDSKNKKIKFFNQKFNVEKNLDETLTINLNDNKKLYIKIEL